MHEITLAVNTAALDRVPPPPMPCNPQSSPHLRTRWIVALLGAVSCADHGAAAGEGDSGDEVPAVVSCASSEASILSDVIVHDDEDVEVIAEDQPYVTSLAMVDGVLYWTNTSEPGDCGYRVRRLAPGGTVEDLIDGGGRYIESAVFAGYVWVADNCSGGIRRVPLSGGPVEEVPGQAGTLFSDGERLYVSRTDSLVRLDADGNEVEAILGFDRIGAVHFDGDDLVIVDWGPFEEGVGFEDARIVRYNEMGIVEIIGGLDPVPGSVVAAGEHTAWLTRVDYPATSTLMLFSSSCGPEPVARVTEVDAFESPLAIDGTTLYWGTQGGAIYRQRLDADDHEVFARGFTSGSVSIVTDDEWVYWAQHGEGGVIRRAPK